MKRPCECGCKYEDHAQIVLSKKENILSQVLYCKECAKTDGIQWCYNYRPIKNLPWLEWLVR